MTTEIYKKTFTGKESKEDLYQIIDNYLNPQKIENLRFVFVLQRKGEKQKKVDCYKSGETWVRVNYIGNQRATTRETDFGDLIKRTVNTMELKQKLSYEINIKLTVYGNNK